MAASPTTIRSRLFQLGIGLGLFALIEMGLRLFAGPPHLDSITVYNLHGADGYHFLSEMGVLSQLQEGASSILIEYPDILWALKPNLNLTARGFAIAGEGDPWQIQTNDNGARIFSTQPPPAQGIALGDSCTFGWGVDRSWTDVLATELGISIQNLAIPGYSILQGERQLNQLSPEAPLEVLTINFGANDGHIVPIGDATRLNKRQRLVGRLRYQASRLAVVRQGRRLIYPLWAQSISMAMQQGLLRPRVSPIEMAQALERMRPAAETMIVIDVCARDEYKAVMNQFTEEYSTVSLIEYSALGQGTVDGCHPSVAGHNALAQRIAAILNP